METFLLIVACLSGVSAFACLLAGYGALIALDEAEAAAVRQRLGEPPSGALRQLWYLERLQFEIGWETVTHLRERWRKNVDARLLLTLGFGSLVVTLPTSAWLIANLPLD